MGCGRNLYILYTPDEADPLVSFVFRGWLNTNYIEKNKKKRKKRREDIKRTRQGVCAHMGEVRHHFTKTLQSFECVATCPIFCHTTITLHKMYLIILNSRIRLNDCQ